MPSPKGGAAIVFGKIQVYGGQGESLDECRQELFKILKKAGYPEQDAPEEEDDFPFDDEEEDEIDEVAARQQEDEEQKEQPWKKIVGKEE